MHMTVCTSHSSSPLLQAGIGTRLWLPHSALYFIYNVTLVSCFSLLQPTQHLQVVQLVTTPQRAECGFEPYIPPKGTSEAPKGTFEAPREHLKPQREQSDATQSYYLQYLSSF